MKKSRIFSLILTLMMVVSIVCPTGIYAEESSAPVDTFIEEQSVVADEAVQQFAEQADVEVEEDNDAGDEMTASEGEEELPSASVVEEQQETSDFTEDDDAVIEDEVIEDEGVEDDNVENENAEDENVENENVEDENTEEKIIEDEITEGVTGVEEEQPFAEGYVRIKADTLVYPAEIEQDEIGVFLEEAVVYAVVTVYADNAADNWLQITFDAAKENADLITGYVRFSNASVLTAEEIALLKQELQQEEVVREYCGNVLPVVAFDGFTSVEIPDDVLQEETEVDVDNEEIVEEEVQDTVVTSPDEAGTVVAIVSHPSDATALVGEYVKFTVIAENAESYQWQYSKTGTSWIDCTIASWPGADTSEVTAKVTNTRNGYMFRCVVTGGGTNAISNSATMRVGASSVPAVTITSQPVDAAAPVGGFVTFLVEAENAETYQWQYSKDGTTWTDCTTASWPGANTAEVTAKVTVARNGYQFRCVVTGNGASLTSTVATLSIGEATEPDPTNPPVIKTQPADAAAPAGEFVTFVVEAENAETYQWQYSKNGTTWTDCTTTSWPGANTAEVTAKVTATRNGYQFRCVITGNGASVTSTVVTLSIGEITEPDPTNPPVIKTQPEDAAAPTGEFVTFAVEAENAETYQWQYSKNGTTWTDCTTTSWPGANTAEVTAKVTAARNGYQFRCVVTGNGVSVTSAVATLSIGEEVKPDPVNPPVIKSQPVDAAAPIGEFVTFEVEAENAETYQWQYSKNETTWYDCTVASWPGADTAEVTAKVTSGRNGYLFRCVITGNGVTVTSTVATLSVGEATEPEPLNPPVIKTHPKDAAAPVGEYVTFAVQAENAETYQWQYSKNGTTWYDCTIASWPGADTAEVTAKVTATRNGYQFRCVVTGNGVSVTSTIATMSVGEFSEPEPVNPPVITTQPVDAVAPAGEYVTFKVEAENAETYQWQYSKTGESWYNCTTTSWPGADTAEVTAKVTNTRDGYQFRCVVTGNGASVTSDIATMKVGVPVIIVSHPENASAPVGEYVTFAVEAENAETYQWQYSKDGSAWIDCSTTSWPGADTAEVTAKVTNNRDGYQFRCVVTGGGVTLESNVATMTVNNNIVVDDVTYEILTTTTCRVVSYAGSASSLVVPETVQGMTVVEIGEEAFMGNTTLVSIDLPDTIVIIRARAFKNCSSLSEMK